MSRPSLAVIGAGLSGLALAYRVKTGSPRPLRVEVFEAQDRPGGTMHSERRRGFVVEHGPNGFLGNKPGTMDLARDLGLSERLIHASEAAARRYILVRGELVPVPASPPAFLMSRLLPPTARLRVLMDLMVRPLRTGPEESLANFGRRRLGNWAVRRMLDPMASGVYAGDAERLSASAAFPQMTELEAEHGSLLRGAAALGRELRGLSPEQRSERRRERGLHSFRTGMGELIEALVTHPDAVHTEAPVELLSRDRLGWSLRVRGEERPRRFDAVAVATPAPPASPLLEPEDPMLARKLKAMPSASVTVAAFGFHESAVGRPLDGFGYLVPRDEDSPVLGCLWSSSVWTGRRAPHGHVLMRVMLGGRRRPEVIDLDDDAVKAAALDHLTPLLRLSSPPVLERVIRWPLGIPQYELGHAERVAAIETHARRLPGLWLCGNAFYGVSMNDCCATALRLSRGIIDYLATRSDESE